MSRYYSLSEVYSILEKKYSEVEVGGIYSSKGFTIREETGFFDTNTGRAYTLLNVNKSYPSRVLWHSHPMQDEFSYPSLEDMDIARLNPLFLFLILTSKGVFVISSLSDFISLQELMSIYKKVFSKGDSASILDDKKFYVEFIKFVDTSSNKHSQELDRALKIAYSKKNSYLRSSLVSSILSSKTRYEYE